MPDPQQHRSLRSLFFLIAICSILGQASSEEMAQPEALLDISSAIAIDSENISGVAIFHGFLILGSDEGAAIQVLKGIGTNSYFSNKKQVVILDKKAKEIDIEGIAAGEKYIYAVGSHSRKRLKIKQHKSAKKNRQRLTKIKQEPDRRQLFRIELDVDGKLVKGSIKKLTLSEIIENHSVLAVFRDIPSKENGIDIEGIAVNEKKHEIYIAFRGPVLRGNLTPVLVLNLEDGQFQQDKLKHKVKYLNLDGLGIRGITRIADEFLILAGPVSNHSASYHLFLWDGEDMVSGRDRPSTSQHIKLICEIPVPTSTAQPEGVEIIAQKDNKVQFLIVYDGLLNGGGAEFSCSR